VWFDAAVPPKQRKALLRGAPRLCVIDAQWPNASLLWASTGDQWIQQHLVEEYGTPPAQTKMRKVTAKRDAGDDLDDDELDDSIAMGGETKKFNADIERWLLALHRAQPILFAARREDGEAGGTKLGAWHKQSIPMFRERALPVLQKLAKGSALKQGDRRRAPISIALDYVGEVPQAVRKLGERTV
jgi:hypothetical protein